MRRADEAGRVPDHERQQLRGGLLGGEDEVALVLPVLVVDHDHRPSGGDLFDGLLDGGELRHCVLPRWKLLKTSFSTYLAITSTSRLTQRARFLATQAWLVPSGGRDEADGERGRARRRPRSSEIPSTQIDPFSTTYRSSPGGSAMRTSVRSGTGKLRDHGAHAVDVALHDVTRRAGSSSSPRALEVDRITDRRASRARCGRDVSFMTSAGERIVADVDHREADPADTRWSRPAPHPRCHLRAADGDTADEPPLPVSRLACSLLMLAVPTFARDCGARWRSLLTLAEATSSRAGRPRPAPQRCRVNMSAAPSAARVIRRSGPTRRTSISSRSIASAMVTMPAVARAGLPAPSGFGAT